jgi:hypothetical protein
MSHSRTIGIYDYSWDDPYIIMEGAFAKKKNGPLQDHRNLWLWVGWCAHCHGWCYLKSFAEVCVIQSRTLESMIIAETVLTLSWTWNRLRKYHDPLQAIKILNYCYAWGWRILAPWLRNARTTPAQPPHNPPHNPPAQPPWEAGWGIGNSAPTLFQDPLAYWQHRWTRQHHWKSWGRRGAYIVMDDAMWNRLQKCAWAAPEPWKCMIVAQTVLTWSWTLLLEIACKSTNDPLQDHQNLWS